MKTLIKTTDWEIVWNSLYPKWHIGKPHEECDVKFEIYLGCLHFIIWKGADDYDNI